MTAAIKYKDTGWTDGVIVEVRILNCLNVPILKSGAMPMRAPARVSGVFAELRISPAGRATSRRWSGGAGKNLITAARIPFLHFLETLLMKIPAPENGGGDSVASAAQKPGVDLYPGNAVAPSLATFAFNAAAFAAAIEVRHFTAGDGPGRGAIPVLVSAGSVLAFTIDSMAAVFCAAAVGVGRAADFGAGSIGGAQGMLGAIIAATSDTGYNSVVAAVAFGLGRLTAYGTAIPVRICIADVACRSRAAIPCNLVLSAVPGKGMAGALIALAAAGDAVAVVAASPGIGCALLGLGRMHAYRLRDIAPTHALFAQLQNAFHRRGLALRIGDSAAH